MKNTLNMNRRLFQNAAVFLLVAFASQQPVNAQAIITKLPVDGTWAKYELKQDLFGDEEIERKIEWTVCVLDTKEIDDKTYRWVEIQSKSILPAQTFPDVYKFLIVEGVVGTKSIPDGAIKKAWTVKYEDSKKYPKQMSTEILSRILKTTLCHDEDSKKLKNRNLTTSVGEVECSVVVGATSDDADFLLNLGIITGFYHPKSPFGCVRQVQRFYVVVEDKKEEVGKSTVELIGSGTNAKSELPENW